MDDQIAHREDDGKQVAAEEAGNTAHERAGKTMMAADRKPRAEAHHQKDEMRYIAGRHRLISGRSNL